MRQEILEDLASQKILLQDMNRTLKKRLEDLQADTEHLRQDISEKKIMIEELRQDKRTLTGLLNEPRKNKVFRNVTIVAALGLAMFIFISYVPTDLQFYHNSENTPLKTQYLIQNLKSGTADTWKPWHLVDHQSLNVNIINTAKAPKEKIDAIKDAILSEETVKIDNSLLDRGPIGTTSTYYKGWQGAVQSIAAEGNTKFHIPTQFNVIESPSEEGDITINLLSLEDADGYSGYTKTTTDGAESLKASITIYNVDKLSPERLAAIVRHEFGHALGLGHSSDQEDLMHYIIETNFPFISDCDMSSIRGLYDGKDLSDVACGQQKSA